MSENKPMDLELQLGSRFQPRRPFWRKNRWMFPEKVGTETKPKPWNPAMFWPDGGFGHIWFPPFSQKAKEKKQRVGTQLWGQKPQCPFDPLPKRAHKKGREKHQGPCTPNSSSSDLRFGDRSKRGRWISVPLQNHQKAYRQTHVRWNLKGVPVRPVFFQGPLFRVHF